jgi:hypothetical protein
VWEGGGLLAIITILPQISDFRIVVMEQKEKYTHTVHYIYSTELRKRRERQHGEFTN